MLRRTVSKLMQLAVLAASFLFAIEPGLAQKAPPPSRSTNLTPVPGQRRGVTNEMRRAAAARTADRRATDARKQKPAPRGVAK